MAEIKYLDDTGLGHLVDKIKEALAGKQVKGNYAELVNGKVPSGMLPAYVDDVVEFSMPDKGLKIMQNSISSWTKVVYDSNTKRFYATQGAEVEDSSSLTPEGVAKPKLLVVYDNWSERENYQELTTNVPYSGKIYIDAEGNKSYRWSGSKLGEISSSVSLGETASTAYPGNKGAANAEKIDGILNGDLPLASLSITPSWKAYTQTGEVLTLPSTILATVDVSIISDDISLYFLVLVSLLNNVFAVMFTILFNCDLCTSSLQYSISSVLNFSLISGNSTGKIPIVRNISDACAVSS